MIKNFIKKINNLIKRIIFKLKGYKTGFSTKKFSSLEEIVNLQTYENLDLINYTFTRAKKARKEKLYEQDSIISTKPNPNKFFIDFLLYDFIKQIKLNKVIKVLDYGGSFGNTFFSLEKYLNLKFKWHIYDQQNKIKLAKKTKIFRPISFLYKHEIKKNYFYDIVLFSTSLQYMKDPLLVLKEIGKSSKVILINNLILTNSIKDYYRIERPDPTIYNYTYPCWFLSKKKFLNNLKKNYDIHLFQTSEAYSLNYGENYYNLKLIKKR